MRIYLVRHGKASKDPSIPTDAERPLTKRGRADVEAVARQIAQSGVDIHQIRHSGLVRAAQTADILGDHLQPPGGVIAVKGLHYADPVERLAHELHMEPYPVMFVGHNPFMENLVSLLLTRKTGLTPVWFTTSCTVCMEFIEGEWSIRWVLNREIMPGKD
ncbi:MAG: phosphohistidine phosphatase SixA [Chloroflexi bacterium]|nr:phosphohistidine phosphatase SixA [Chloroflexota bacterium]